MKILLSSIYVGGLHGNSEFTSTKVISTFPFKKGPLVSALRGDIRQEIKKENGLNEQGMDFYTPFWASAKNHALNGADLHHSTENNIRALKQRERLYPLLRDGFLLWWNERRRWTNSPFVVGKKVKSQYQIPELQSTIKINNILSARDNNGIEHYVYPYFAEKPILSEEAARLGLWILCKSLPDIPADEIRILDIIRGRTFSIDKVPFKGNEEASIKIMYKALIEQWEQLRTEYP